MLVNLDRVVVKRLAMPATRLRRYPSPAPSAPPLGMYCSLTAGQLTPGMQSGLLYVVDPLQPPLVSANVRACTSGW